MVDRDYILSEIRRTAQENDGSPLGAKRFADATGIKPGDWLGKHWARWNDALKEAGLPPNAFQTAFDDDSLLAKLADYVRELGHFPVKAEIQLRAHTDKTFPSYTVWRRRGSLAELAAATVAHCESRPGCDDVSAVCSAVAKASPTKERAEPNPRVGDIVFGEVYLLRAGKHYKIGRSNAAGRRERELAIQLPEKAALIHAIKTDDPPGIEFYWHRRFADRRMNGEWFELTADDVAAFRRRRFM